MSVQLNKKIVNKAIALRISAISNFKNKANIELEEFKMEPFQFLEKTAHKNKVDFCSFLQLPTL